MSLSLGPIITKYVSKETLFLIKMNANENFGYNLTIRRNAIPYVAFSFKRLTILVLSE
jgi:hypothetical protein